MSVFLQGDIKYHLPRLPSESVNLIYIDPPFGTTRQPWDESLDWQWIFKEFFRILSKDGMIVIHCSVPFNYELIRAAPKPPLYSWYWNKKQTTCPLIANVQPLRCTEEILIWKKNKTTYYRQQIGDEERESKWMTKNDYYGKNVQDKKTVLKGKTRTHLIEMLRVNDGFSTRPKEIVKLMIDSYTKPGDTILDCFCYRGVSYTQSQGRRWIGIDKYFFPNCFVGTR